MSSYVLGDKVWLTLLVPELYPWILAGLAVNFAFCNNASFGAAGMRREIFNPEFMKQFKEEHKKNYPETELDLGGNPDSGNGWYSKKLPLADWVRFNTAMRIHLNYVENLPLLILTTPIAGLYCPIPTMVLIWTYALASLIYECGYKAKGNANFRLIGLMLRLACIGGLIGCALTSGLECTFYAVKQREVES